MISMPCVSERVASRDVHREHVPSLRSPHFVECGGRPGQTVNYETRRHRRQCRERHVRRMHGRCTRRPAGRRLQPHGMGASGSFELSRWTERCSSRHSATWSLRGFQAGHGCGRNARGNVRGGEVDRSPVVTMKALPSTIRPQARTSPDHDC